MKPRATTTAARRSSSSSSSRCIVMVPLVYLVVAVADRAAQRTGGVAGGPRGRPGVRDGRSAARGMPERGPRCTSRCTTRACPTTRRCAFVPAGASCTGAATTTPVLSRGRAVHGLRDAHRRHARRAARAAGRAITTVGEYDVHVDDYRVGVVTTRDDAGSTLPLILGFFLIALLMVAGRSRRATPSCSSAACRTCATAPRPRPPRAGSTSAAAARSSSEHALQFGDVRTAVVPTSSVIRPPRACASARGCPPTAARSRSPASRPSTSPSVRCSARAPACTTWSRRAPRRRCRDASII